LASYSISAGKDIELKVFFTILLLCVANALKAQKVDNLFINLYTDSLKKGTYNYINVDGLLSNGNYTPLDSTSVIFWASDGKFYGNSLLIDKNFQKEKVLIKIRLRSNPAILKEFTMFVKRKQDDENLKTVDELMSEMQSNSKKKTRKKV